MALAEERRAPRDQCQFGQTAVDADGSVGPARKAVGFMTNEEFNDAAMERRCCSGRPHVQLLRGRAKAREKVPTQLVRAILRALEQSVCAAGRGEAGGLVRREQQLAMAAVEAGQHLEEPERTSIPDSTEAGQAHRVMTTGLPLSKSEPALTKQDRAVEMQYMEEPQVLEDSDLDTCPAGLGGQPLPTNWVGIDLEDWAATFAAALPYEAVRLQLGLLTSGPRAEAEGNDEVLMREVFEKSERKVYQLLEAMCGLRDAGASFVQMELDMMNPMGKFSSCVGYRPAGDSLVRLARWDDDFSVSGRRSLCVQFRNDLEKHLMVETTAVLGPDAEEGDVQEAVHSNRLLKLYPRGAEGGERVEPVETLPTPLRLEAAESKVIGVLRVRLTEEEDVKELDAEERACRVTPPQPGMLRAAVLREGVGAAHAARDQHVVSDWAGCARTRRSTPSSYVMLSAHLVVHLSTTQNVVATSRAIGAAARAADMAKEWKPVVRVDATASKAPRIAQTRGPSIWRRRRCMSVRGEQAAGLQRRQAAGWQRHDGERKGGCRMAARRSSPVLRVAKRRDLGQRPEATGWLAQAEVPREGLAGHALHLRWQNL